MVWNLSLRSLLNSINTRFLSVNNSVTTHSLLNNKEYRQHYYSTENSIKAWGNRLCILYTTNFGIKHKADLLNHVAELISNVSKACKINKLLSYKEQEIKKDQ